MKNFFIQAGIYAGVVVFTFMGACLWHWPEFMEGVRERERESIARFEEASPDWYNLPHDISPRELLDAAGETHTSIIYISSFHKDMRIARRELQEDLYAIAPCWRVECSREDMAIMILNVHEGLENLEAAHQKFQTNWWYAMFHTM